MSNNKNSLALAIKNVLNGFNSKLSRFFSGSRISTFESQSFFTTQIILNEPFKDSFLTQKIRDTSRMKGRTAVKIICECVQNDEYFEKIIVGSAFGSQSLFYATAFGYKGGIIEPFPGVKIGEICNFKEKSDSKEMTSNCLSNWIIPCVSAEVIFEGDYINGAQSYTWPRIRCNFVRLQEIDAKTLTFEITRTQDSKC